jgi:hypothetical protein
MEEAEKFMGVFDECRRRMIKEQSCNGSTMLIGLGFQIGFSYVSISD